MATITIDDNTVTGEGTAPNPPTGLATQEEWDGVRLSWTNPTNRDLDYIEIWRSTTNDRSTATMVAEVKASNYVDHSLETGTRYYWIRSRNTTGLFSNYEPNTTAGVSGLPEAVADIGTATQGQVLAYDGTQWANTANITAAGTKFQFTRTQTGTGGNLITELVRNRTDGARTEFNGPWLGFNYTGTDGGFGMAALQALYRPTANGGTRLRYQSFTSDYAGGTTVFQTDLSGTQIYSTGFTGAEALINFAPSGHSINANASSTIRVWNTTPGPTLAFQAEHRRTDVTTPADGDAVDFRLRVSGSTTGYGVGKVESTYRTSGLYEISLNVFNAGATTSIATVNSTQESTIINARATAGTGPVIPSARFTATTVELLQPASAVRLTSTQIAALSPVGGWIVFNITTNKLQCYDGSAWQDLF